MESGSVTISLTQAPVEIRPLTGRIGAELPGLDLTEVDDEAVAAIRTALLAHKVLFFRDQRLDPESHRAFAARFGPLTKAHPEFGGDTMWANTVAAYERLPESFRGLADGLRAVHTNAYDYARWTVPRRVGQPLHATPCPCEQTRRRTLIGRAL